MVPVSVVGWGGTYWATGVGDLLRPGGGARPGAARGRQPEAWVDPCVVYRQSGVAVGFIRSICEQVTGPGASSRNSCTAQCLSDLWADMFGGREAVPARQALPYLYPGHRACYDRCGYTLGAFMEAFAAGFESAGRPRPAQGTWAVATCINSPCHYRVPQCLRSTLVDSRLPRLRLQLLPLPSRWQPSCFPKRCEGLMGSRLLVSVT